MAHSSHSSTQRSETSKSQGRSLRFAIAAAAMLALGGLSAAPALAQAAAAPAAAAPAAGAADTSAGAGDTLFHGDAGCSGCHGDQGQGDFGPALANSPLVQEPTTIIRQVIFGGGAMPALGGQLNDGQIAAVVNYVRTKLNTYTNTVTADDVTKVRNQ